MTSPAPNPPNEKQRLARLQALSVLDTAAEPLFDSLVQAAALVAGAPIALVSLIDAERQWFKANHGLGDATETPRDAAFCAHAILGDEIFEVPDTRLDPKFVDNPLVVGNPGIRFYAGAPLTLTDGLRMGTLCVIDRKPRMLTSNQREILTQLAHAASQALEQRVLAHERTEGLRGEALASEKLVHLLEATGAGTLEWHVDSGEMHINAHWAALVGRVNDPGALHSTSSPWLVDVHPDDLPRLRNLFDRHLRGDSAIYFVMPMGIGYGWWTVHELPPGTTTARQERCLARVLTSPHGKGPSWRWRPAKRVCVCSMKRHQRCYIRSVPMAVCFR